MLFLTWIASIAAIVTIAVRLEGWLSPAGREKLNVFVDRRILREPHTWLTDVSEGFLFLFDRVFGWDARPGQKAIWTGVFLTYSVFPLAHLVLLIAGIPTPSTELILGAVLFVASVSAFLVAALLKGPDLLPGLRAWRDSNVPLQIKPIAVPVLLGMGAVILGVSGTVLIIHGIGVSVENIAALSIGACLALPLLLAISQIPNRFHPISPMKSIFSSMIWLMFLCLAFPEVAASFLLDDDVQKLISGEIELGSIPDELLEAIANDHASWVGPVLFLVYNLVADTVSLAETRFILLKSLNVPFGRVAFLLLIDIVLSTLIYVALPLIAGQDLEHLWQAVFFKGPVPYLGLLFWSTFATSFLFYLFVLSSALLFVLSPLSVFARKLSTVFDLNEHPLAAIAAVMITILTIGMFIVGIATT